MRRQLRHVVLPTSGDRRLLTGRRRVVPVTGESFGLFLYVLRVPRNNLKRRKVFAQQSWWLRWTVTAGPGRLRLARWSDGQPEGADDAVHGLVLPSDGAAPCGGHTQVQEMRRPRGFGSHCPSTAVRASDTHRGTLLPDFTYKWEGAHRMFWAFVCLILDRVSLCSPVLKLKRSACLRLARCDNVHHSTTQC